MGQVTEYEEIKEPKMLQFKQPGACVEMKLLSIQLVTVRDKEVPQYTGVERESGELVTFLGTYDICRKLRREHIGRSVIVRFEGEDREVKTQGSPLRRFYVGKLKGEPAPQQTPEITDADIPF